MKEKTFVINNNNSREIINIKEERKRKIKQSYLYSKNIQFAGYTHSIKSHKRTIRVNHLKHHIYSENTHNNYQVNVDYNINYMHGKYRTSDNYNNNNYNYKSYRGYHK